MKRAYLFGWNPIKFKWETLAEDIGKLAKDGKLEENWSVASHKSIRPGDRAYIVRLGAEPRGIFASGVVSSEPYPAERRGRSYFRIKIELDVLLNPDTEPILTLDHLNTDRLGFQTWTPQASGISIKPQLLEELENVWLNFLADNGKVELL